MWHTHADINWFYSLCVCVCVFVLLFIFLFPCFKLFFYFSRETGCQKNRWETLVAERSKKKIGTGNYYYIPSTFSLCVCVCCLSTSRAALFPDCYYLPSSFSAYNFLYDRLPSVCISRAGIHGVLRSEGFLFLMRSSSVISSFSIHVFLFPLCAEMAGGLFP